MVIAGTASGVGKTSLALGLVRALKRRSLNVQPFKVGPDFLDPTYHTRASGRTCYNLDGWMTDRDYVCRLFDRATAGADIALIEGVMGLFDGADAATSAGSTAEIARWLRAPVLLVVDSHGMARTFAAVVKGFVQFEPDVPIAGVLANRCGSQKHVKWLAESLRSADLPPLVGAMPGGALEQLESRHLGLVTADAEMLPDGRIDQLADACEQHVDIDAVLSLAKLSTQTARHCAGAGCAAPKIRPPIRVRIGVARDEAFHFCYPDNLEALRQAGAEIVPFSPMADESLPSQLGGVYLPGGYPELHAETLSANRSMLAEIRRFAQSGKCVYGECGGLMYLGRELQTLGGQTFPMAGVVPIATRMLDRRKSLGYVEVTLGDATHWGPTGTTVRGHEFHYSEIAEDESPAAGWRKVYSICHRRADGVQVGGFQKDNVLAGYPHLHWASRPELANHFVKRCEDVA